MAATGRFDAPPDGRIRVELHLRGWLKALLPGGRSVVQVPRGTTVSGVVDVLGVPLGPCLWIVNGEAVGYDTVLIDGDRVEVAMMASGG